MGLTGDLLALCERCLSLRIWIGPDTTTQRCPAAPRQVVVPTSLFFQWHQIKTLLSFNYRLIIHRYNGLRSGLHVAPPAPASNCEFSPNNVLVTGTESDSGRHIEKELTVYRVRVAVVGPWGGAGKVVYYPLIS
jgi:hypothetical protein